ncbi:RICIN domain-containing protein [Streptomyces sp. NPDC059816]|uniref:RICIN domain-containing protein n=1 Tax=Streptomyces sp. NPDC059816 TaxID=3346960 RepID=UPI00365DFF2C
MTLPLPPRPNRRPHAVTEPDGSDVELMAAVRSADGHGSRSRAALLSRHGEAVHDYAVLCAGATPGGAPAVVAAAFDAVLDAPTAPGTYRALRPRLLLAVRESAAGERPHDEPDRPRPLADRAFGALSSTAQHLLWHTEVEGEPLSVPAALLSLDPVGAAHELNGARRDFMASVAQAHLALTTSRECRQHLRLRDVLTRQGAPLPLEVDAHLRECGHCRSVDAHLRRAAEEPGTLLVESVLFDHAAAYLSLRHGRHHQPTAPPLPPSRAPFPTEGTSDAATEGARPPRAGRHRARGRAPKPADGAPTGDGPPPARSLLAGAALGGAVLTAALLTAALWPGGGGGAVGSALPGAPPARSVSPSTLPGSSGHGTTPSTDTVRPVGALRGELRNVAAGLCLDVVGRHPLVGARATLLPCADRRTQQWSYEGDGLLRSGADPGLCLDSHAQEGVAALGNCAGRDPDHSTDVRYDLTVQGQLVPRWKDDLALTPTTPEAGADVVVKVRDRSAAQRWTVEPGSAEVRISAALGVAPD